MTNRSLYPQTVILEEFVSELTNVGPNGRMVIQLLEETFLEYEHGTADIEDVFAETIGFELSAVDDEMERRRICLNLYRKVLEDVILVIANGKNP